MSLRRILNLVSFDYDYTYGDDTECIICNKVLSLHDEIEAKHCYNKLKQLRLLKTGGVKH